MTASDDETVSPTAMHSRISTGALIVMLIGSVCWLGGLNVRALIGFDLLQMGTLDFKPNIHPYVERAVFGLVGQSSLVVDAAYVVVWLAGVIYLRSTPLRLKENGWLMMSVILFYIFTPVEIYTAILDLKLWHLDFIGSNDLVEFRTLFIHRLGALAGVPMIALLSYYTIIVLAIVRPMRLKLPFNTGSSDS